MRKGKIYCLICPKTGKIRYIGQTKQKGNKRFHQHKYQWSRSNGQLSYVNAWIKGLYNDNLLPIFEIIEDNISEELLNEKEINYIKLFKSSGAILVNIEAGGGTYKNFTQREDSKIKRLNTLKSSKKWKIRSERHSQIMKDKHKDGVSKIGFKYFSNEKLREMNQISSISRQKKVKGIDLNGESLEFPSIREAAKFYNIKDSTHIVRVLKGKSKSGMTHNIKFSYL